MNPLTSCLTIAFAVAGIASAQTYVAVDLTPNAPAGSLGTAASGGAAGGSLMVLGSLGSYVQHGFLASGGNTTDINPAGWFASGVLGMAAAQQVGWGAPVAAADASAGSHALLWYGSASGYVDLHPAVFQSSGANCTNGIIQGGYGIVKSKGGKAKVTPAHALVWLGSAGSVLDMNPSNMAESKIYGCSDTQEGGYGMPVSPGFTHAMLWTGTSANTAVDLNPAGYLSSIVFSVAGGQQAGTGVLVPEMGGARHALLWTGSAASVVDLNPAGYISSAAFGSNGVQQVGTAQDTQLPAVSHAIVWSGTAASAVDLNAFLPPGYTGGAGAYAIDAAGNIFGTAGGHMFLWQPVR